MLVGGLPVARPDHAAAVCAMALGMIAVIRRINEANGTSLSLRIGVHTGPVVAGVIGRRKFTYDLWGETVNLASRLESTGAPDRVHVSEATCMAVRDEFRCGERGLVDCKGLGEVAAYYLEGRRA